MTNIIPSATKNNLFAKKCYTFIEKSANKFLIDTERYGFMIYKPSKFNYFFVDSDELMIVNFKKGLSTFTIVTGDDIALVKEHLSSENICINHPTDKEQNLIDNGFLIPIDYDENSEAEMLRMDYIYDNRLQLIIHVTKDCNFRCKYCFLDFEHQKMENIYCFDDISNIIQKYALSSDKIYYPKTTIENIDPIPLGMLYRPWVPILGVYGTTSKQGKFTFQLILREKFLRDDYCVGQIGTEPSAYLFDMDLCFHFGYHSTTNINRQNMVSYLNSEINNISQKDVDIIISGCQSGSVTYDFGNAKYYTFSQSEFLLGTLPDAVILCVNSYDETDYVGRTIKYIESCVDSKVIALVVYPMGYNDQLGRSRLVHLSDTELNKSVYMLSSKFNIPTYILGKESDMEKLYTTVIAFFTSDDEVK